MSNFCQIIGNIFKLNSLYVKNVTRQKYQIILVIDTRSQAYMFNRIPFNHNPHISHIYTHQNGANLWVGSEQAATNLSLLARLDIYSVLTVADQLRISYKNLKLDNRIITKQKNIDHLIIRAHDMPSYIIKQHFGQSNKYICENLSNGNNVLVHCAAGISRSVTIIMAFLIKKLHFDLKNALIHIKSRRSIANPNYGFLEQLKDYEEQLQLKNKSKTSRSLKNYTQVYCIKPKNEVPIILNQRKQFQIKNLQLAFEDRLTLNNRSVQSKFAKYQPQRYLVREVQNLKEQIKRYKSTKGAQQKYRQIQKQVILQKSHTKISNKRVDTQVLFPKIVVIKSIQKIQNQKIKHK